MAKLFLIVGLQRTGCHAIANWLLHQTPNISPESIAQRPDCGVNIIPQNALFFNAWQFHQSIQEHQNYYDGSQYYHNRLLDTSHPLNNCVMLSEQGYLNLFLQEGLKGPIPAPLDKLEICKILTLRDVRNTYASFIKKHGEPPVHIQRQWVERAEEILDYTHYMGQNVICINFNMWATSKDYRRLLASILDLTFTDVGIQDIPDYGSGSSFQDRTMDGRAQNMDINNRYQLIDQDFLNSFITPYAAKLSEEIFGI